MTDIQCIQCGHVRETTERYPTIASCPECGSMDREYVNVDDDADIHV